MKRSESVTKIAAALLKAQKLMGGAAKGAANPYFKSKYADYGSVLEACKDLLNENGVVILQPHTNQDSRNYVETLLLHESGEFVSSLTEVVCAKANDPQALGSAITYARRYGLQSLLAMPAEDDDGEKAMARTFSPAKAAPAKTTTPQTVTQPVGELAKQQDNAGKPAPAKKSSFKASKPAEVKPEEAPKAPPQDELAW